MGGGECGGEERSPLAGHQAPTEEVSNAVTVSVKNTYVTCHAKRILSSGNVILRKHRLNREHVFDWNESFQSWLRSLYYLWTNLPAQKLLTICTVQHMFSI